MKKIIFIFLILSFLVFSFSGVSGLLKYYNYSDQTNIWAYGSNEIEDNPPPPNSNPLSGFTFSEVSSAIYGKYSLSDNDYGTHSWSYSGREFAGLFNASVQENINDISLLNWTWEGYGNSVAGITFYFYLWNASALDWYNCAPIVQSTSDVQRNCNISSSIAEFNDTNNNTAFLVYASASSGYTPTSSVDFVKLEVTYDGLIINTPSDNDELLNTKNETINISATTYNDTIWYTINEGKTNTTLFLKSEENETSFMYPRQGYFNLTVYANKSDGTEISQTVENIFVGNITTFNFDKGDGTNITHCDNKGAGGTPSNVLPPACSGTKTDFTTNTAVNISDDTWLTNGGLQEYYYFVINITNNSLNTIKNITSFLEGKVGTGGIPISLYIYNHSSSSWLDIHSQTASASDKTWIGSVNSDNFILNEQVYLVWWNDASSQDLFVDYVAINVTYYTPNTPPNTPTLITPADLSAHNYNGSVSFNYTAIDADDDNITYSVFMDYGQANPTTLVNITINESGEYSYANQTNSTGFADGTYYWKVYAYDGVNPENISSPVYSFIISTDAPAITLNQPPAKKWFNNESNIFFNWTATDSDTIDTCNLSSNWTGTWHNNYTNLSYSDNVQDAIARNLTEGGKWTWNVWCNDTTGQSGWGINATFGIDLTLPTPLINSVSTTAGSQTFTFSTTVTDGLSGVDSCWYSIFDSAGVIDGLNENVTFTCGDIRTSATTTAIGTYNLTIYTNDSAGNENNTNRTFTIASIPITESITGGGGNVVVVKGLYGNWTIETETGGLQYQFNMISGSKRTKTLLFENLGEADLNITMSCRDIAGELCKYVNFSKPTFDLPTQKEVKTENKFTLQLPDDIENGDYVFNIIATDNNNVPGSITTNVNIGKLGFLSEIGVRLFSSFLIGGINFPYAVVFIFSLFVVVLVCFFTLRKIKVPLPLLWSMLLGVMSGTGIILLI